MMMMMMMVMMMMVMMALLMTIVCATLWKHTRQTSGEAGLTLVAQLT